jgi:hypothetical protein
MSLPMRLLVVLLLASGCSRRVPEQPPLKDPFVPCRTLGVRYAQTGGACAPFSHFELAQELLREQCDDATLAQARQRLQQESGLQSLDVVRSERVPGTNRHWVFVRYASSEPGTCAEDLEYPMGYCEDCPVKNVFLFAPPLGCDSRAFTRSVFNEVKERVPTCGAEKLDAARAQLWQQGWFSSVQLKCVTNSEGLTQVVVDVEIPKTETARVCKAFKGPALKPRCPAIPTDCTQGQSCTMNSEGCHVCTCGESGLAKLVQFLLSIPAAFLDR